MPYETQVFTNFHNVSKRRVGWNEMYMPRGVPDGDKGSVWRCDQRAIGSRAPDHMRARLLSHVTRESGNRYAPYSRHAVCASKQQDLFVLTKRQQVLCLTRTAYT